ncbi:MAG: HEAT repeat domain-containing protein [Myxococcales bacterium]|nr:HEAT repeat domain-containing protein [Myxococcales bacterium]
MAEIDDQPYALALAYRQSASPSLRRLAALRWGRIGDRAALGQLVELLADADESVRIAAAWALDQLHDLAATPCLVIALADLSFEARSASGWALVHLGERVVDEVAAVLRDGSDDAKEMALLMLRRIAGAAATEVLRENGVWVQ